jgi:hypothetical protein
MLRVTHQPDESRQPLTDDVDANGVQPLDAGDRHFLVFSWNEEPRLVLPADTVLKVETV